MEEDVRIEVPGGLELEGRFEALEAPRGGLVVCHPHPLYGGDMDNPIVGLVARVGSGIGLTTLRFNFRGVGRSTGNHDQGEGEQDDLRAAVRMLRSRLPDRCPLGVAGYSFGSWIAARVARSAASIAALCLIAPPLRMLDFGPLDGAGMDVLLVSGTRDPYCPTRDLETFAERLPAVHVERIDGADHFFLDTLGPLGGLVRDWTCRWSRG
jgi:alpha/beta superfamily hydrolase